MSKHISYFILKKNHKTFRKKAKTRIRKKLGDFFEISKRNGIQIKFREDKWNRELFEPIYSNINLKQIEKELTSEYNALLEINIKKNIEKFGLIVEIIFFWNAENYYEFYDISVSLDNKFYKTKLDKEIGKMLAEDIKYSAELSKLFISNELVEENKKLEKFLKKCNNLSKEVGFDVFENYLN